MKTIRVKAAPGRRVPIHSSVARAIGGAQLFVEGDVEHELPDVSFVRRRITAGDLVVVPVPAVPVVKEAVLRAGGAPAIFGDAKPLDAKNPGPHTAAPIAAPTKESP